MPMNGIRTQIKQFIMDETKKTYEIEMTSIENEIFQSILKLIEIRRKFPMAAINDIANEEIIEQMDVAIEKLGEEFILYLAR